MLLTLTFQLANIQVLTRKFIGCYKRTSQGHSCTDIKRLHKVISQRAMRCCIKFILFLAMVAILFSRAYRFDQFRYKPLW